MTPNIVVYEDQYWHHFLPLVYTRPVYQLICGMGTLLQRIESLAGAHASLCCREELRAVTAEKLGRPVNELPRAHALYLNGRGLWKSLPKIDDDRPWVGRVEGRIACFFAGANASPSSDALTEADAIESALEGFPERDVSSHVQLLDWPWNLIHAHPGAMREDWQRLHPPAETSGRLDPGVHLLNEDAIHIGAGTRIKPCVVIDAEDGPVWIGRDVRIMPHSYIQGPAFIGEGSLLQTGAVVREGTHIGPVCKVGGEIEGSIIHGFSNKQHDGFMGHSYIGSWINIAADCINSDLKNTYGTIRVPINGREVETGQIFMGMLVGDHSKIGINVSIPTGAVIGFCSSLFAVLSPKWVPSFTWVEKGRLLPYDTRKGLEVAAKVMARRRCTMSDAERTLFLRAAELATEIEFQSEPAAAIG